MDIQDIAVGYGYLLLTEEGAENVPCTVIAIHPTQEQVWVVPDNNMEVSYVVRPDLLAEDAEHYDPAVLALLEAIGELEGMDEAQRLSEAAVLVENFASDAVWAAGMGEGDEDYTL